MIARTLIFAAVCLAYCKSSASAQSPQDLSKILQAQFEEYENKHFKWLIEQESIIEKTSLGHAITALEKDLDSLDQHDPQYALKRQNLENNIKAIREQSLTPKETIEIIADFASVSKWRISVWPKHVPQNLATLYIADGSGTVYEINNGQNRIRVSKDPTKVLADVMRGIIAIRAQSFLYSAQPDSLVTHQDHGSIDLKFINSVTQLYVNLRFDPELRCTTVQEISGDKSLLSKLTMESNASTLYEFFNPQTKQIAARQRWKLVESSPIKGVTDSMFKYSFSPGYLVELPSKQDGVETIDSEQLVGKNLILE